MIAAMLLRRRNMSKCMDKRDLAKTFEKMGSTGHIKITLTVSADPSGWNWGPRREFMIHPVLRLSPSSRLLFPSD
jgi:hypothetical protein